MNTPSVRHAPGRRRRLGRPGHHARPRPAGQHHHRRRHHLRHDGHRLRNPHQPRRHRRPQGQLPLWGPRTSTSSIWNVAKTTVFSGEITRQPNLFSASPRHPQTGRRTRLFSRPGRPEPRRPQEEGRWQVGRPHPHRHRQRRLRPFRRRRQGTRPPCPDRRRRQGPAFTDPFAAASSARPRRRPTRQLHLQAHRRRKSCPGRRQVR